MALPMVFLPSPRRAWVKRAEDSERSAAGKQLRQRQAGEASGGEEVSISAAAGRTREKRTSKLMRTLRAHSWSHGFSIEGKVKQIMK